MHFAHMRAVEHTDRRGLYAHHAAWVNHTEKRGRYEKTLRGRRVVPAVVNVRGLQYVIPDSVQPTGKERDEQTRAYRKKDERRGGGSGPWNRRPRREGGASANFRVLVGANFCFEGGGYDYRGGCDGGSSGGGRR